MIGAPSPVWDNLWLAGAVFPMPRTPVDLVVEVCMPDEVWFKPNTRRTLSLPLTNEELLDEQHRPALENAAREVEDALRHNQKVIVHCRWGMERSALVVALVLMHLTGSDPEAVIEHLRAYRDPDVLDPDRGDFLGWLEEAS